MIFWILVCLTFAVIGGGIYFAVRVGKDDTEIVAPALMFTVFVAAFPGVPALVSWGFYAGDYAKVVGQTELIAVYEAQRDDLTRNLSNFPYPEGSALMNADSPVASLAQELASVQRALTHARAERAKAMRDVVSWKVGPLSGVVSLVGDPTQ